MTYLKFQKEVPAMNTMPAFNSIFNNLFDGMVTSDFRRMTSPSVNIIEAENEFKLQVAAPGMKKEDFKVNVENDLLTISAEVKQESSEKSEKFTRKEFSFGSFKRSFTLPETIDVENIKASYENGIMMLSLPKRIEMKPKTRAIQIG